MSLHLPGFCRLEFRSQKRGRYDWSAEVLVYPPFSEALAFYLLEDMA